MEASRLKQFYYEPFKTVDGLDLTFKGNQLNIFLKYKRLGKTALAIAIVALVCWVLFGFDSTPVQWIVLFYNLPNYLSGSLTHVEWTSLYGAYYGKEMHYSAFVIYGLMYYALSRHFENKFNIINSKNVAYAASLTLFSIAVFEFYWMGSYAIFQGQPWVITPRMPQLRIILQNVAFLSVGLIAILYMWADSYIIDEGKILGRRWRFNWNKTAWLLIGVSIASAVFWWRYGDFLPVESLTVEEVGWSNSPYFPQTLYTIDIEPDDNVNAGVWFFVENNLIHGVNTLVKALWTFSMFFVMQLKVGGR